MIAQDESNGEWTTTLRCGAVLLFAVLMMFASLALHPTDILVGVQRDGRNDVTAHNIAARNVMAKSLASEGAIATWLEHGLLGSPWLGNPQSAMFYPPHWLFLIVDAAHGMSWLLVAHHWWAGLGVFVLCRRLGCSATAALTAGICFSGAPFLIAQTGEGHSTQVFLISWAPWAFVAYNNVRRGVRGAAPMLAAIFAIAFFCGHVQEVYFLVLIQSVFVLADCVRRDRDQLIKPHRLLGVWFVIGMTTAYLVAIELIPNWIYTRFGIRAGGIDAEVAGQISAGAANLRQLLSPFALGGPENYTGPGDYYWETLCCFGVVPLSLALIGCFQARRRSGVISWIVLGSVAFLFAMGADTPVFPLMHRFVPGMSLFRAPGRALFFASLAVSVLAAFGWDGLASRFRSRAQQATTLSRFASLAVIVLCIAELSYYSHQMLATIPQESLRRQSTLVEALKREQHVGRVLTSWELLSDREALDHQIDKLRRYEPVPLARTVVLINSITSDKKDGGAITGFAELNLDTYRKPMLDMLNITHVALAMREPQELEGWEFVAKGVVNEELALRGRDPRSIPYCLYRNKSVMPRAYVIGKSVVSSAASRLTTLNPRDEVLVSSDLLSQYEERQPFTEATIVERSNTRIVASVALEKAGYLVLSEAYYPGWRTESGKPIAPANFAVRGVPLPPGEHTVTFLYTPPGRFIGMVTSAASWLVVILMFIVRTRRKPAAAQASSSVEQRQT